MADFCNFCAKEMFGDEIEPDIDVYKIFEGTHIEYYTQVGICEGCGLVAVYRTINDDLQVCYIDGEDENGETKYTKWEDYTNKFHVMGDN